MGAIFKLIMNINEGVIQVGNGPQNADPSRVTMITQTGADNRAHFLERSLFYGKHFFDRMIVTDSGATDNTREVCRKHGAEVVDFDWTREPKVGPPSMFAQASASVPVGEWIFWMDSDECPSPSLFGNLKYMITLANTYNIGAYSLPHCSHWFNEQGVESAPSTVETRGHDVKSYVHNLVGHTPRLIKKTPCLRVIHGDSHWIVSSDLGQMFYPSHYNHYKGIKEVCKSCFIQGLSFPASHHLTPENFKNPEKSQAWLDLRESKGYGLQQISRWSADKSIPEDVMEILSGWKNEHVTGDVARSVAHNVWRYVFEFNMEALSPECHCTMCNYEQLHTHYNITAP